MREYLARAFVLDIVRYRETDNLVDLYVENLGRIEARVTAGRKILSKLSPHLPGNGLSLVRLVNKNKFIVTDATIVDSHDWNNDGLFWSKKLELFFLLRKLLPPLNYDMHVWNGLRDAMQTREINFNNFSKTYVQSQKGWKIRLLV